MPKQENKNPYDILGIEKTASREDIRKAYLLLCRVHHPDMGGDEDFFKLVVWAYELLYDDDKRNKFDEFGIFEHFNKEQVLGIAKDNLISLFKSIIVSTEFAKSGGRLNLMHFVKMHIMQSKNGATQHLADLKRKKESITIAMRRIKRKKKPEENFVIAALESEKMEIRRSIASVKMDLKIIKKMDKLSTDFEYIAEDELGTRDIKDQTFSVVVRWG